MNNTKNFNMTKMIPNIYTNTHNKIPKEEVYNSNNKSTLIRISSILIIIIIKKTFSLQ